MKAAVRWHERAVSGKLSKFPGHAALARCTLPAGKKQGSRTALPAGLSAVLRDRRSAGSGVPIRFRMTEAVAEGDQRPWTDDTWTGNVPALSAGDFRSGPVVSKALVKAAAAGEHRVVSSPVAVPAGKETDDAVAGIRSNPAPSEAPDAARRSGSGSARMHTLAWSSASRARGATDPVPAGRASDPMPLNADGSGKKVPGDSLVTAKSGWNSLGFSKPVVNRQSGRSDVAHPRRARSLGGLLAQAAAAAPHPKSRLVVFRNEFSSLPDFEPPIDRVLSGPPGAPPTAAYRVPIGISETPSDSRFRNPTMDGHDVVPRRGGASMHGDVAAKPHGVVRTVAAAPSSDHVDTADDSRSVVRNVPGSRNSAAAQAGMMVTLRGDVMMDGRKMGHMVASGQTRAASLPMVSGSAINLRALPIYAGTSAAL